MSVSGDETNGTSPVIFERPTLGHAARLGELYDQRTGKFLGVQLYPQDKVQEVVTDIRHTKLSLSLSTTHEEKATLLDINANLSLEVLSGLVKVSGSASYLNDSKSNTHEQAFALALKMRLNERRILFAEEELGRNVLEVAQEDYITDGLATHFVSAIVYGGNLIVNLVAKRSELSKEEKLEGKLEAELNNLKGAISLQGSVEAKISEEFESMNDKFDLVIHGDVALEQVPINPQDVLETIPDAAKLITTGGGVPISVTLQPIPKKLITGSLVYKLDADFMDGVLKTFSMLDDISSRFAVLRDTTKSVQEFIPELTKAVRLVSAKYTEDHSKLLHQLRRFLYAYQHSGEADSDSIFVKEENPSDVTGDKVLEEALDLHNHHLDLDDARESSVQYPTSLMGLESELSRFRGFASDIRRVRNSLETLPRSGPVTAPAPYLSDIEDVCRAIRCQNKIPLFIMVPLTLKSEGQTPDLAIVRFLALFRKYAAYFKDPSSPAYIFYAEDLKELERRLPNNDTFSSLDSPSVFIGLVDINGTLTWSAPPPAMDRSLKLHHKPSSQRLGNLSFDVDIMNVRESFSFQIRAKAPVAASPTNQTIYIVQCADTKAAFLQFKTPLKVMLKRHNNRNAEIHSTATPALGQPFVVTFVQDAQNCRWCLYLDNDQVGRVLYTVNELLPSSTKLQIAYNLASDNTTWWNGEVHEVKAFSYALTGEQVAAEANLGGDDEADEAGSDPE